MIVRAPASRRSRPPAQEVDLVDNKLTEKTVEKLLQTSHWEREPHKKKGDVRYPCGVGSLDAGRGDFFIG